MSNLRQFGVELECYHPTTAAGTSRVNIAEALRAMGYPAVPSHYSGTFYDRWQIKPDGSLRPEGFALEVVAPTLPGTQQSLDKVTKVANWLSANGFDVNSSCGMHIHIDAADMTQQEAACIAWRYNAHQTEINQIMPPSRRASLWARPLVGSSLTKVRDAATGSNARVVWGHNERRVAVNLEHIHKGRSAKRIEFRQHSGTLNAGKIVGWYTLLCEFIAETLRLVRGQPAFGPVAPVEGAPFFNAIANIPVRPLVRRQRTNRGATRSVVIATAPPRMPQIDAGTDYDLFLRAIEERGVVTMQDSRSFGWPDTRLRVTAHWLRRHGAALITTQRNGENAYVGANGATTRAALFSNPAQIRQRVSARQVYTVDPVTAPPVSPAAMDAILQALADAPVLQGASEATKTWFATRRAEIALATQRRP